ncbi:MAG: outer membrane protein assembly factor BamD [Gloeobacteraceae cyanobacterium ES-bin-316]|nr:outer membrane protein assembly factor BamD [Ferruginibacter sp.]
MKLVKVFSGLLLFGFLLSSCSKYSKVEKSKDVEYKLTKADEYYAKKKYRLAQQLYESLFPVYKGTQKFEDLYYKYAYCFYYQGLYSDAENLFKGYLEVFPTSTRAEEVDYMRAYSYYKRSPKLELEQVNTVKSMNMMQSFINTHPGSAKNKDATEIIDASRAKLEQKEFRSAQLYFNLEKYRAAAISFTNLLNKYPESFKGEEYKLMVIKSYYRFAKKSYLDKQVERFEKVISEYGDFAERFPESKFLKDAEEYNNLSITQIKAIKNEQNSSTVKR